MLLVIPLPTFTNSSPQRITAQIIRTQYEKTCLPDQAWILKHGDKAANLQATMADLNTDDDQIIIFEAVKVSDTSRLPIRQPLQATNSQILSPPRKQNLQGMDGKHFPISSTVLLLRVHGLQRKVFLRQSDADSGIPGVTDTKPSFPNSQGPNPHNENNTPNSFSHSMSPRPIAQPHQSQYQGYGMLIPSPNPAPATTIPGQGVAPRPSNTVANGPSSMSQGNATPNPTSPNQAIDYSGYDQFCDVNLDRHRRLRPGSSRGEEGFDFLPFAQFMLIHRTFRQH